MKEFDDEYARYEEFLKILSKIVKPAHLEDVKGAITEIITRDLYNDLKKRENRPPPSD